MREVKTIQMHDIGVEYPASGEMRFYDLGTSPAPGATQILVRTHYTGISNGTERNWLMSKSSIRCSSLETGIPASVVVGLRSSLFILDRRG